MTNLYVGLFLLSTATLMFEVNLTRIFSVAQFYHFAFMTVSLALLGFGAGGTMLAVWPRLRPRRSSSLKDSLKEMERYLAKTSVGFVITSLGAYGLMVTVPFDSFRIAHDWHQAVVLAGHYLALAAPFCCSGVAIGALLAAWPERAGRIYGTNLGGSAAGCLAAVLTPRWVGGSGVVCLAAALATIAAGVSLLRAPRTWSRWRRFLWPTTGVLVLVAIVRPPSFEVPLSPYKSLSYVLLYPDARPIFQRWNGFSRVDVVETKSIRSLPGRGFRCTQQPPPQRALTVDGDDLTPITHVSPGFSHLAFTDCLLMALPYRLRPAAQTLVLEPRGGFDVLVALSEGAQAVTAVEANPLVVQAVREQGTWAGDLYDDPRVRVSIEEGRTFARRDRGRYDVVVVSLNTPYRPVTSGAYSLVEDYRYTVEAFGDYLARLDEGGLLVVTRWLQVPPSEAIRAFALAVEAVENAGGDPRTQIVALRSYQQMTILIRRGAFTAEELATVRAFAAPRAFDLVYLPDLQPTEVNRYNVMPEPIYHQTCTALLEATDRTAWYRAYPFDVRPPHDERPFFGHFFKWEQRAEVLASIGHTWQPFGGAGYFVLLALLVLATLSAFGLIVLPLGFHRGNGSGNDEQRGPIGGTLVYFGLLGMAYLGVEIPLIQQFILFLGHPAYAVAVVLFTLLLFSGVGSWLSGRWTSNAVWIWIALPAIIALYTLGLPAILRATLSAPAGVRVAISVLALAPPAVLMGMPFPQGIARLETRPRLAAWAWSVNGAVSVVASVLAALMALSWGFSAVLGMGAICYVGAGITGMAIRGRPVRCAPRSLRR